MKRIISNVYANQSDDHLEQNVEQQHFSLSAQIDSRRICFPRKFIGQLQCRVCGDRAHGFNFDQITCESCKAFFRRNALRSSKQLKCRYSGGCEITVESRRQCSFCRLKKCFDVNMKKEWIRTEEERQLRELKRFYKQEKDFLRHSQISIVERKKNHRLLLHLQTNPFQICEIRGEMKLNWLKDEDHSMINNINQSYDQWTLNCARVELQSYSKEKSTILHFLNNEKEMFRSLIDFYKAIAHFKQIQVDDQILLIKCNLTHLVHLHHILKDRFVEPKEIGSLMSQWIDPSFHHQMSKTRHYFDFFMRNPIVLKLTLVLMIFTINLSRLPNEDCSIGFVNPSALVRIQHFYVTLLWKYLNSIFDEKTSIFSFQLLITQFLRYQLLMHQLDLLMAKQFPPDLFHPLTKSLFRLS